MKICTAMALAALAIFMTSCATTRSPQAFNNTDDDAMVIDSLDNRTGQLLEPTPSVKVESNVVLEKAKDRSKRQTALVILENYDESQIGLQYRIHGTPWFIGLRGLGYDHIVFLQGRGVPNPEGLITLTEYF